MPFVGDMERAENSVREDIRVPLIQLKEAFVHGNGDAGEHTHESSGKPWMVYLSTSVAVCGAYEFGAFVGYTSPTEAAITEDLGLSTAEYSLFGSLLSIGAMIGAITSGPIADFIGRKGAMGVYGAFCAAGWLAIYFAQGVFVLDIGRLAGGYGMGALSYVVPVYIAEIAPTNLRGALTSLNQVMICTGVSAVYILGIVLTWRALALTGLIPCAFLLFGLFFIPESPRWLAKRGDQKEFEVALQKLRGKDADITCEATGIQNYIEELQQLPKANVLDLFQRRYRRSVIVGIGLMIFQQLGGIGGISFYSSSIFESAGISSTIGTTTYACIQIPITIIGVTLIDKAGRKPLLLVSATGLALGCVLAAISFYLKAHELAVKAAPILALTGILVYIASFAAGLGAIPWVVMSEIFPLNIKGIAGSLATLVNWFCSWAVSYTFNFLMSWSNYGTFVLYAAVNALAVIFVVKIVPETKRRTLEAIQAAITA
ncbi:hypothetical protein Nepgr_004498 [Nepenthes gracilis]|uniref:Major facilitator superfamily (MFS) profile domain-containing protein n=1 Tax=Nepenthes gracilis TaxID=150966 RepID=A0AAD3S1I2_NEPGR|nr:hypothetical protein Nepgr_004498 [Nepenthes gracilis]